MANKNSNELQTFIVINGKAYDARSGRQFSRAPQVINDFVPVSAVAVAAPVSLSHPVSRARPQVMDIRHPQYVRPRQTQTAQTLMRSAVKRPAPGLKRQVKAVTRTDILAKAPKEIIVLPKLSVMTIDPKRQQRAKIIVRHEYVQHFAPNVIVVSSNRNTISQAPESKADITPYIRAEQPHSLDVFERALARADSHTEKYISPKQQAREAKKHIKRAAKPARRQRTASIATVALLCLLLLGFVAYANRSTIAVHYASAKAGFHVSLPTYKPTGFAVSKLAYAQGSASVAFNNRVSQQSFTLNQRPSSWDDSTLLTKVVAASRTSYQTLQNQGRTVFVYNDNNAAWISNGILYQLQSYGNLSTSQVLDLASSI